MGKLEKIPVFPCRDSDRFFAQDMNAALQTEADLLAVNMVGRGYISRIDTALQKDVLHCSDVFHPVLFRIFSH